MAEELLSGYVDQPKLFRENECGRLRGQCPIEFILEGRFFQCDGDNIISEGGILGQETVHLPRLSRSTRPRLRGRDQAVQIGGLQLGLLHP